MIKRLNYLKNSLETHNSRETTQHLRDEAEKRRDERIMELWKNDLEKPSVYDLVSKMKKQQELQNQKSNKFVNMLNTIKPGELSKSFDYNNNNLGKNNIFNTDFRIIRRHWKLNGKPTD